MLLRLMLCGLALAAVGCGETTPPPSEADPVDPGQVHIHGLGLNPADGSLFIATHTGLFRAPRDADRAQRVGDGHQDTMGFAIVGPDHFLGSGHPDASQDLPPYLGLIQSRDAGRTWTPLSLHGEVDFHVLEAAGPRVYGYGSDFATREPRFLTSTDAGRTWDPLQAPEPLVSLAVSPADPDALIASGPQGVHRSSNGGKRWTRVDAPGPGHLAWTQDGVVLVAFDGRVWHGAGQDRWRPAGDVGVEPAAFDHGADGELLVAGHDGVVQHSADAGRSWAVRSRP
ncbi:hypothetical protein OJ998_31270 [Solirubrobacter taibaiensis]|nr:hypothetical protein [Solirubrobacter taibaiensis]